MNQTDKMEIENLLEGIKGMDEFAHKENEKFVDEKVVAYAKKAIANYKENKEYVIDIMNKHLTWFFTLNKLYVGGFVLVRPDKPIYIYSRCGLFAQVVLTNYTPLTSDYYKVYDMKVLDVRFYTSDTDDKRYNICSSWDLVDSPNHDVAKMSIEEPKTPCQWKMVYNLATITASKNKIMVDAFKESLTKIYNEKKAFADSAIENKKALEDVGEYKEVKM